MVLGISAAIMFGGGQKDDRKREFCLSGRAGSAPEVPRVESWRALGGEISTRD